MNKKIEKTFKPNIQWMAKKYEEMNQELFYGQLGDCDFGIFTTGKGSEGRTLGWFKTKGGVRQLVLIYEIPEDTSIDKIDLNLSAFGKDAIKINLK